MYTFNEPLWTPTAPSPLINCSLFFYFLRFSCSSSLFLSFSLSSPSSSYTVCLAQGSFLSVSSVQFSLLPYDFVFLAQHSLLISILYHLHTYILFLSLLQLSILSTRSLRAYCTTSLSPCIPRPAGFSRPMAFSLPFSSVSLNAFASHHTFPSPRILS